MALAPLLSWRSADAALLWRRIRVPAWSALGLAALLVAPRGASRGGLTGGVPGRDGGGRGPSHASRRESAAHRRGDVLSAPRAPRSGGMIVHLGVILAIGIVVSVLHQARRGDPRDGTEYDRRFPRSHPRVPSSAERARVATQLKVRVDGTTSTRVTPSTVVTRPSAPRRSTRISWATSTSHLTPWVARCHLGRRCSNLPAGSVVLGVTVEPLLSWLWIGGLLVGLGSAISFVRRRHVDEPSS